MEPNEKQTLEMLPEMKKRWGSDLNPYLQSLKLIQTSEKVELELTLQNDSGERTTIIEELDSIGGSGEEYDSLLFNPENSFSENVQHFVKLDGVTIIMCLNHIFHREAAERIYKLNLEGYYDVVETLIDITKLQTVKNWAAKYGINKSGRPYSASYGYKLFADDMISPTALEIKEQYAIVDIDGVSFVIERIYLPANFKHLNKIS